MVTSAADAASVPASLSPPGTQKTLGSSPPHTPLGRRRRPELDALVLAATWCLKSELHHLL